MNRTNLSLRAIFVVTVASSLFAFSAGCSSGEKPIAPASVSLLENPRSVEAPDQAGSTASANNARDLANAQPEEVLNSKPSARDVGLNGGDAQAGQPLTYQALGAALQKIGLTPEDDKTYWEMKVKATTEDGMDWTFPINVSLSKGQNVIWINCMFGQVDKNAAPSAQSMMDLLTANSIMGTCFFLLRSDRELLLQQSVPNVGVSPSVLGESLKEFFRLLKASEPLYRGFFSANPNGGGGPFQ